MKIDNSKRQFYLENARQVGACDVDCDVCLRILNLLLHVLDNFALVANLYQDPLRFVRDIHAVYACHSCKD